MRLWISVHLPLLPLEALRRTWCEPGPYALIDRERVLVCSGEATAAGVQQGMRQGGVSAIAPQTTLLERDLQKEQLALDAVSLALLQYTPEVALSEDCSILMDVSASLRAFGGSLALCRRIASSIKALGFTLRMGAGCTALGAWLLARSTSTRRCPIQRRVIKMASMTRQLDRLPCSLLPALTRYCDDGIVEIDNSAAERALRGIAVGRRNYLFADADSGGERAAAICPLIGAAKLNGVDPEVGCATS